MIGQESARLRETLQVSPRLANLLDEQERPARTKRLWAERRQLWHASENRVVNKLRWLSVTSRYLWCRSLDKGSNHQNLKSLQAKTALFTHLSGMTPRHGFSFLLPR